VELKEIRINGYNDPQSVLRQKIERIGLLKSRISTVENHLSVLNRLL
jgi:hypothetical protein